MKIAARSSGLLNAGLLNTALIAALFVVILVVTLSPAGTAAPSPGFVPDTPRRGAGDAILNFFLFVPLGIAIGWPGRTARMAGIIGLLAAAVIEMLQLGIPGRDPTVTDILLNAAGSLVGAVIARRRMALMRPNATASAILTAGSLCALALVMTATAYALFPVPGTPLRGSTSLALPPSPGNGPGDLRSLMSIQLPIAPEPVLIGRSGNDLLLRYPSRGATYGFDQPEYWRVGAFDGQPVGQRAVLSMSRHGARWEIGIGPDQYTIGPTVGRGWAILAYPDAIGRRWGPLVSALWLFALCLPAGFWARGRSRIGAALIIAALFVLLPPVSGIVGTTVGEWTGGMLGFAAGVTLARASDRWLSQRET